MRVRRWMWISLAVVAFLGGGRWYYLESGRWYEGAREPYQQRLTHRGVTLRWQTEAEWTGVVEYGPEPGKWIGRVREEDADQAHEVVIKGLVPDSQYYYQISHLEQGVWRTGEGFQFRTAAREPKPTRLWVLGDPGKGGENAAKVRDAALNWMREHPMEKEGLMSAIVTTGDNAYRSGRNTEFQKTFFTTYGDLLRRYVVWPGYGNHDARRRTYFDIFTFPQQGEAGGVPSGSPYYYAFDHGAVHVVFLDSQEHADDEQMRDWLERDLAANESPWQVVIFHHPPYTRGSHNSDDPDDSDGRMQLMREEILPILERHGVDLVLSGHSHMYERTDPLACHYGDSASFRAQMVRPQEAGVFIRPQQQDAYAGTLYAVVGSSSKVDQGPLDHPANVVAEAVLGSLVVDADTQQLRGWFIDAAGKVRDQFTLRREPGRAPARACP